MINFLLKKGFFASFVFYLYAGSSFSALAMEDSTLTEIPSLTRKSTPQNQLEVDQIVISTAEKTYKHINQNWTYVLPNQQMSTDSEMWRPEWINASAIINGAKQDSRMPTLVLKVKPHQLKEALDDLIKQPASVECTIALTTTKIACLKELLGENYFTLYATAFYFSLGNSSPLKQEQFFHELPEQFLKKRVGQEVPGALVYITNTPLYATFKPNGNGRGDNLICTDKGRYVGFGGIYKDGSQPLEVIEEEYLSLFCEKNEVEGDAEQH
ncbi:MAG: hypothetical protein JNJ47_05095, partial [Alphaproteobacteria bacterium]|nr:hypothetical protein [Alphaproteobacteria bacterium]